MLISQHLDDEEALLGVTKREVPHRIDSYNELPIIDYSFILADTELIVSFLV